MVVINITKTCLVHTMSVIGHLKIKAFCQGVHGLMGEANRDA